MTPAQALLASVRAPATPIPPSQPSLTAEEAISAAKRALAPGLPLSAWLRAPGAPPHPTYLPPSSVEFPCVARYADAHPRVPFSEGLYAADGGDLPRAPTVWAGLAAAWPSLRGWDAPALAARCAPGDTFELDGGPALAREGLHSASVGMAAYAAYAAGAALRDSAPLYVFDPALQTRRFASGALLSSEFAVPACLSRDEMAARAAGEAARPLPPRWLLVGAPGSGTPIHNHPLTAAWNVLLRGVKLWVVLPPDAPPEALLVGECCPAAGDEDLSADAWLRHWRGALPRGAAAIVQREGETVFLPAAWWHVVLNVTETTAISSSIYLERDWKELGARAAERGDCEGFARVFKAEAAAAAAAAAAGAGEERRKEND
jgi:hypothetical protein